MTKVKTKTISQVRNSLFSIAGTEGITAVTRNGVFIGVIITCGESTPELATLRQKRVLDNPVHTVTELTKGVLD
ncbi:MAG: hypothetical protein CL666_11860 [Balneola sp.]|nr:hypothetical protein [Balneola sp.]|tara:strand:- start:59 stop:280 length:222 start_codon:yes stop_codon:yes gene_type:complete